MLRCLTFVAAAVFIIIGYRLVGLPDGGWAVTSVALVMQSQARTSLRAGAVRVAANLIGAVVALAALQIAGMTLPAFAVALLIVGLACHFAGLDDGVRSAYICVVIVVGADRLGELSPPVYRVAAVAVGSAAGIGVSWLSTQLVERTAGKA